MKNCIPWRLQGLMYVKKILVLVSLYILISGGAVWVHGKNNSSPAPSPELPSHDHGKSSGSKKLSRTVGETTYNHMCSFCHGLDGNGGGKARAYLYPWARDFRKGIFKFRSTPTGSLPLDSDIFKTITSRLSTCLWYESTPSA